MFRNSAAPWLAFGAIAATLMAAIAGVSATQRQKEQKLAAAKAEVSAGRETFEKYCAPCHGKAAKGDGPAAMAMKSQAPDLTTLAKRYEGKYPSGYVSAVLNFGKSFASHG